MKNNIFAIECETKSYIDINIYSATKFFNEKYISDYIYNFYTRKEQENGFWDLYEKNKKMYYKEGKKEFEYRYQRRQLENKIVRLYFSLVDFLAATIAYLLNLSDSIKEFSNCKDLETMYENLRNVTDDVEYIRDKLYPIYQKFYENEFEKKL